MPEFEYRAVRDDGRSEAGRIEAWSRVEAIRQLKNQGLTPLQLENTGPGQGRATAPETAVRLPDSLRRKDAAPKYRLPYRHGRRLGHAEVLSLTNELAVMLRAGLPLDKALKIVIDMSLNPLVKSMLEDVFKSVKAGKGFSQALQSYQQVFGEFYINMIRSGEAGGSLADVLGRLAEHLERVRQLREGVVSALIYPAILVVVASVSVLLMLGFVVPQFETLFDDMGEALPLATRFIVGAGHFVADWGWLLVLILGALGVGLRRWLSTPIGRSWIDARMLRLPLFGDIVRKYELTRFARSMGTLLGDGVPIVSALRIAADTMSNQRLRAAMDGVVPAIKQGGRLAEALEGTALFSPLALNMVRLGEETGRLDSMLTELARVNDDEVQASIKRGLALIEPALILAMGGIIAGIIVSILLGILSVNDLAV